MIVRLRIRTELTRGPRRVALIASDQGARPSGSPARSEVAHPRRVASLDERIAKVTLLIGALAVGHDLDHLLNQPARDYAIEVTAPGLLSFVAIGGTLFLALRRDPLAPLAAVLLGFSLVVGFTAVHLLPHWSAFSDPYGDVSLNALSWFFVLAPIAAGLLLATLGLRELASSPRTRHA